VIEEDIKLRGLKGESSANALFDSGSFYSCIKKGLAEKLGVLEPLPEPLELGTAKEGEKVVAEERVVLDFWINEQRFSDEFMVIPDL
jgi:hypothetical protein